MVSATLPTATASPSEAALLADVTRAVESLRGVARHSVPGALSGRVAQELVALLSEAERAAASGVALLAPRVVETGEYTRSGHGSAADWLGSLSGSSSGAAKGRLAAATRAAKDPRLTEALHAGDLSTSQLALVTKTSAEVPHAAGDLLELVDQGASHKELSDAATKLRAASRSREDERRRRARVHTNRHFRWGQDEHGGIRGAFFCDEVEFARIAPRLEAEAKARWKAAGSGGDSLEAHRLDAFIDLMGGGSGWAGGGDGDDDEGGEDRGGPGPGRGGGSGKVSGPRPAAPRTLIIVNAESLRRGSTEGDELCEIEGIGPVSVAAATELLSEGGFQYLVKEGFDIKTVTKSTRAVANCIDMALIVRDRVCARPGCGNSLGLERDHWRLDYGNDGPTELDNLARLCPECHRLKTDGGWRLEGRPGAWRWVAPATPPSAQQMARARKVAVAKAKAKAKAKAAFVKKDPSGPRRT
jgi:HNH endonuclease